MAASKRGRKPAAKGATAKGVTAKSATAKKAAAKKPIAKATTAKATTAKGTTAKGTTAKKPTAKATTAKAITAKATIAKATTAKAATAKATKVVARPVEPAEDAPVTLESVLATIEAAEEAPLTERLQRLDELDELVYKLEDDDEQEQAQAALESAQQGCIDFAHTDADARAGFIASVLEHPYRSGRIELLAKIASDDVYDLVCARANAEIDKSYDDTNTAWLFALGAFAKHAQYADDVRAQVLGGLDRIIASARKSGELANAVAYGGLAFAAMNIAHPETGPALHAAFRIATDMEDFDAHYNLNQSSGAFAIALATLGYQPARDDIAQMVGTKGEAHGDEEFVLQGAYALYMLDRDGESALASLRAGEDSSKNLGLLAAAIADLDYKDGKGELFDRVRRRGHAMAKAAFAEALKRLNDQSEPPAIPARMIWMFGRVSPVERALGHESDNIFRLRAEARRG